MNDTAQNTALTVHDGGQQSAPAVPKTPLVAGGTPKALVPVDFDGAYRIANVVHRAGMAPASLDTLEKVMVAILHGLEVGLTPMNALQSIAVINGRPTIWGDGAVGLIRASGLLEYMQEFYEKEDTSEMKAVCVVKRKGEPKEVRTEFSMADAKKADLLGKKGPWQTYPKRMLKMRARWALRDTFSDVLKGLSLREEVEDIERSNAEPEAPVLKAPPPPPAEVAQETATTETTTTEVVDDATGEVAVVKKDDPISSGPISTDAGFPGDTPMTAKAPAPPADDGEIPWQLDRKLSESDRDWLLTLKEAWEQCSNVDEVAAEQESIMAPAKESVSPHAWKKACDLMDKHIERVQRG